MLALFNPLTLLLASLCVEWFVLATIGTYSIKLPYLALVLVCLYAASSPRRIKSCLFFVQQNAAWIVAFILYLLLLGLALYGSPGENTVPRQFMYFVGCIAFGGSLAAARDMRTICRVGAGLAVVVFITVVEIAARKLGLSWVDAIGEFARSGDLHFVVYTFLRTVFSSLNSDDVTLATSVKNAIAVTVLISGLLFRSASTKPSRDIVGMAHMAVVLGLMILLNTRSVLIAGAAGVLLAIGLRLVTRPGNSAALLGLKALSAIVAVTIVIAFSNSSAVTGLMTDRFSFQDQSAEARVEQYQVAIDRIEQHPWAGSGYYEVDGYPVHNLFLSAWMNGGIAALLTALFFYLVLFARWLGFLWMLVRKPERWVLPLAPEWIAALPIDPFIRVWLSGAGGNMFLGEWVAIGLFLGLLMANELKCRQVEPKRSPGKRRTYTFRRPAGAAFARQRVVSTAFAPKR
jgi:O-antigen ligase